MLKPLLQSLKDRINQLDMFITRIRKSFFEMVKTIIEYVKYFLGIAFKSSKYFISIFILIFTIIFFLSKEKKGNLCVVLYFFLGYMMFIILLSIIKIIILIFQLCYETMILFFQATEQDRTKRQRLYKVADGIVNCFRILGLLLAAFCIFFILSFFYSAELYLYDVINEIFRGKTL